MDETEGTFAVRLARKAVDAETKRRKVDAGQVPDTFHNQRGVFVTLNTYPDGELRGCIGFPEPVYPLAEGIIQAAKYACHDPRFADLREEETDHLTVEVSILTVPELVEVAPAERAAAVEVGKDGLIIENGPWRGSLLPQVASEWHWNAEEFLAHTCTKAGLAAHAWQKKDTLLYKFQAEIFAESSPRQEIRRHENRV